MVIPASSMGQDFEMQLKERIRKAGKAEPPQELFDTLRMLIEEERGKAAEDC